MESVIVWIRFWIVLSLVLVSIWEKRKEDAKIIPNSPPCLSYIFHRRDTNFNLSSSFRATIERWKPICLLCSPPFSPAIVQAPRYYAKRNNYFPCVLSSPLVNPRHRYLRIFFSLLRLLLEKGVGFRQPYRMSTRLLNQGDILCGVDDVLLLGISMTRGTRVLAGSRSIFNRRCVAYRRRHEPPAVPNRVVWSTMGGANFTTECIFENPLLRLINTRCTSGMNAF